MIIVTKIRLLFCFMLAYFRINLSISITGWCAVNGLQVLGKGFTILPDHILEAVADLVDDTALDFTWGKTERMASLKPVRPSTQAMNTASTPRFFKSVNTLNQKLAPSLPSPTQWLSTSL